MQILKSIEPWKIDYKNRFLNGNFTKRKKKKIEYSVKKDENNILKLLLPSP